MGRAVAGLLGTPLIGEEATLSRLRALFSSAGETGVSYLHLASHGIADFDDPSANRSFVALSAGGRFDGQVAAARRSRQFGGFGDGAVVALSACQSGLGAQRPGGIVGLPRMLQLAGAQSVVMSMWSIDDEATRLFMTTFAEELKRSGRAARAYDRAMEATRAQFPDEADWGAFVLFSTAQF